MRTPPLRQSRASNGSWSLQKSSGTSRNGRRNSRDCKNIDVFLRGQAAWGGNSSHMDQKRPKGRGIEEIAHFFFSSRTSPDESITPRDPPKGNVPSAKIFALVSLVEALPTPLFTSNLAIDMAARQKKVLVADTPPKADWHAMN